MPRRTRQREGYSHCLLSWCYASADPPLLLGRNRLCTRLVWEEEIKVNYCTREGYSHCLLSWCYASADPPLLLGRNRLCTRLVWEEEIKVNYCTRGSYSHCLLSWCYASANPPLLLGRNRLCTRLVWGEEIKVNYCTRGGYSHCLLSWCYASADPPLLLGRNRLCTWLVWGEENKKYCLGIVAIILLFIGGSRGTTKQQKLWIFLWHHERENIDNAFRILESVRHDLKWWSEIWTSTWNTRFPENYKMFRQNNSSGYFVALTILLVRVE